MIDQSYRQEPMPSVRAFAVVRVLVPAERAAEARRILAEARPGGPPAGRADESEET